MSYQLIFRYELRSTFSSTRCDLFLLHELQVTVYCTNYELLFAYELRVTVYCMIYELIVKYVLQREINDRAVFVKKVMIKNYSLGSFFVK